MEHMGDAHVHHIHIEQFVRMELFGHMDIFDMKIIPDNYCKIDVTVRFLYNENISLAHENYTFEN